MSAKLDWIKVLNEEATWKERSQIREWLNTICGRSLDLGDGEIEQFEQALARLRIYIDGLHFGEPLELEWLDAQLADVRPTLSAERLEVLPLLHARAGDGSDGELLRCITRTILLQFGQFLSQTDAAEGFSVVRCEGLYREPNNLSLSAFRSIPEHKEVRWRSEIPALVEQGVGESPQVQRCPDIFVATPKGRFCSDKCRFTTFQLTKQLKEPRYHAEKQKRYRDNVRPTNAGDAGN